MQRSEDFRTTGEIIRVGLAPNNREFCLQQEQIEELYSLAFAGFPWYESLAVEDVKYRLQKDMQRSGFRAFLATSGDEVIGAHWSDTPTLTQLMAERGEQLGHFIDNNRFKGLPLVWERELMVRPDMQGRGIGSNLRTIFLRYLEAQYRGGALVLTRMRDDNTPTLTIAQRSGFFDTRIRTPSSQRPDITHGYYIRPINYRL